MSNVQNSSFHLSYYVFVMHKYIISSIVFLFVSNLFFISSQAQAQTPLQYSFSNTAAEMNRNIQKQPISTTKAPPKKKSGKKKTHINIPIELGFGPTFYHFSNIQGIDPQFYRGISLSGEAVITKKIIRENKHMIPKQYRKMALAQDEIRISKIWIPDSILFTNNLNGTSMYGASFRPVSMSLSRAKKNKGLNTDIGARFTYAYISHSNTDTTSHFLRLGLDGRLELRIPLQKQNSMGIGWISQLYLPAGFLTSLDQETTPTIIPNHVGQFYIKYYYRFPYKYKL